MFRRLRSKRQNAGTTVPVLKRCVGSNCKDEYIVEEAVGEDVRHLAQ